MDANYLNSRSVVINPTFKQSSERHYDKHKMRLNIIKNRKSDFYTYQHEHQNFVKKKLGHKNQICKVKQQFDPSHNQVKSLVKHIAGIVQRKVSGPVRKESTRGPSLTDYRNNHKKHLQDEKKEIMRQNQILTQKIKEQQTTKMTKKQLKKQFKVYESQRNLLRKVHYSSQKPKKKNNQSSQMLDKEEREHMD